MRVSVNLYIAIHCIVSVAPSIRQTMVTVVPSVGFVLIIFSVANV